MAYCPGNPIPTGRIGTIRASFPYGNPTCRMEITSRHVEVHTRTLAGHSTSPSPPTVIQYMDDGGPVPSMADFDFVFRMYRGTNGFKLNGPGMPFWHAPQTASRMMNPGAMIGYPQYGHLGVFDAQTRAAYLPAGLPQQPTFAPFAPITPLAPVAPLGPVTPLAPVVPFIGASANLPILIEDDNNDAGAHSPFVVNGSDNGAQDPIPAPKEATAEPLPPSHLRERLAHLKGFVINRCDQLGWLETMKAASYKQQEEYCRLFWPANEQAEVDLDWVTKHFSNFTEAYIERRAVEGRKRREGLDWEKDGEGIAAGWEMRKKEQSEQAKRDKELREKATKRKAEREEQRRIRLEEKEKRDAEKRAADEAKKRRAEEEKAAKAAEKERQKLTAAAEKQKAREEEKERKAGERKARHAAAPSRKRKATPTPVEPAKKRKTNARLLIPTAPLHIERPSVGELKASIMAESDTEVDDDDDGLGAAIMAAHDSEPPAESEEESDADDDEVAPIFAAQVKEPASEPPTRAITAQEQHTAAPPLPAQAFESAEEVESEDDCDSLFNGNEEEADEEEEKEEEEEKSWVHELFDIKAEEESEDESEDESEVEEEPVQKVLSPREQKRAEIETRMEEVRGQMQDSRNELFRRRCHQCIDSLRREREQYL
ncbi:hypothetical protein PMIN06_005313 [Paraphaeosphaeria minitans]